MSNMREHGVSPAWYLRLPPPIWGILFLLAAVAAHYAFRPALLFRLPLAGLLVVLVGFGLAFWAQRSFAAAGTEIMPTSPVNSKLVMRGPFAFTRNPLYLGLVLVALGIALSAGTLPVYAVPVLIFLLCHMAFIPYEEAKMRRQFGDPYTEYTRRVRRWL
jgi:protein-S-isoprenylcysteine O-methyltransferase Ste14